MAWYEDTWGAVWDATKDTGYATLVAMTFGDAVTKGFFDYENDASWRFNAPSDEIYKRLCKKFVDRNYFKEMAITPLGRWKIAFMAKMNEIMPKYAPLYERIAKGYNPLQTSDEYGKSRNIYSEFPETLLNGNSDYVSTGTDREYEITREGDITDATSAYAARYNDVDVLVLNELDFLFSALITSNMVMW